MLSITVGQERSSATEVEFVLISIGSVVRTPAGKAFQGTGVIRDDRTNIIAGSITFDNV